MQVRDTVDRTKDPRASAYMRMHQVLIDAATPHQAVLDTYQRYLSLQPAHVIPPKITREAAGQFATAARDRATLRAPCATPFPRSVARTCRTCSWASTPMERSWARALSLRRARTPTPIRW
jgi:hypothetical protein